MADVISLKHKSETSSPLDRLVEEHLQNGTFPGVEILMAQGSDVLLHQAWGHLEIGSSAKSLQINTLFDVASLTKPIATASAIMMLQEQGLLDLSDPVAKWVPEYQTSEKRTITLKQLLTHTSGLPAWENLYEGNQTKDEGWKALTAVPLECAPNTKTIYSCLGYLLLGEIIRQITGESLSTWTQKHIFEPLNMKHTSFKPQQNPALAALEVAPTQYCPWRKKLIRGEVHDENASLFDQEGGNAGLFSTARDLHRFCQMLFHQGTLENQFIATPISIQQMVSNQNAVSLEPRGCGWDIKGPHASYVSCGSLFPNFAFGHTGFTGTSLWADLTTQTVIIILSNRVHLSRESNLELMKQFRPRLHNLLIVSLNNH